VRGNALNIPQNKGVKQKRGHAPGPKLTMTESTPGDCKKTFRQRSPEKRGGQARDNRAGPGKVQVQKSKKQRWGHQWTPPNKRRKKTQKGEKPTRMKKEAQTQMTRVIKVVDRN